MNSTSPIVLGRSTGCTCSLCIMSGVPTTGVGVRDQSRRPQMTASFIDQLIGSGAIRLHAIDLVRSDHRVHLATALIPSHTGRSSSIATRGLLRTSARKPSSRSGPSPPERSTR